MILYPLRPNLVREKRSSSVIMTRNIIMISRHKKKNCPAESPGVTLDVAVPNHVFQQNCGALPK